MQDLLGILLKVYREKADVGMLISLSTSIIDNFKKYFMLFIIIISDDNVF